MTTFSRRSLMIGTSLVAAAAALPVAAAIKAPRLFGPFGIEILTKQDLPVVGYGYLAFAEVLFPPTNQVQHPQNITKLVVTREEYLRMNISRY